MDNLKYLHSKSSSHTNKNLEILKKFFTKKDLNYLSEKSVSIVGTNGKTSTASILNDLLLNAGLNTCLFTSPHLVQLNERIQINSKLISDLDLAKYIDKVCIFEKENEIVLGYFESIFLIAASYFLDRELDVFIVEAGIGGRLDTTSILNSQIVCLTNVDLDHTELLGNSIEDILFEKIKISQNVKCFILGSNKIHRQYESIIKEELNIDDKNYELSFSQENNTKSINSREGVYTKLNEDLATTALKKILNNFHIKSSDLISSENSDNFEYRVPKGRFQVIDSGKNFKIIDGAHNPAGLDAFFNLLEETYTKDEIESLDFYIAFNKNKDFKKMLDIICNKDYLNIKLLENNIFYNQLNLEAIESYLDSEGKKSIKSSLSKFHLSNKASILIGSLYLVGEYIKEYK